MAEDARAGYGRPADGPTPNPGPATVGGLPGGVRLPWIAALASLLLLAAGFAFVLGRTGDSPVPQDVVTTRAAVASATAESVRRGLDEAVDDLVVLAAALEERDEREWDALLSAFVDTHARYPVVYLVGEDLEPDHVTGNGNPRPALLPSPLPTERGIAEPRAGGNSPVLLAWAPVDVEGEPQRLLVGRYEPRFFGVALSQLTPGSAYLVDRDRRVVGSTEGFTAFQALPSAPLGEAVDQVADGSRFFGAVLGRDVVTASPVRGESPAGRLGLTVVGAVDARTLALPAYDARRLLVLVACLTALLAALSLFWLYLAVVGPVRRLAGEAERVAFGDRSEPVHVVRYDEIGLVTRALERCRVLLAGPSRRS